MRRLPPIPFGILVLGLFTAACSSDGTKADETNVADSAETAASAAEAARPAVLLFVEVDRNQINYYAVASSPYADFAAEAVTCSNQGKSIDNERYCWVFPTREAYDASNIDPDTGEFGPACWMAFGGTGVGEERAAIDDIRVSERYSYDVEGCPPF